VAQNPQRKVVIGFDGSGPARDALALGETLCRALHGRLVLAYVYPFDPRPLTPGYEREREQARRESEATLREAPVSRTDGAGVERIALAAGSAARGLHELAVSRSAGVLVLGSSHRSGLGRVVPGRVASKLLHGASCPLAIAPAGYAGHAADLRTVAVGFDGSEQSVLAAREAAGLALGAGARLLVIAVVDTFGAMYLGPERQTVLNVIQSELDERIQHLLGSLPVELRYDVRLRRGPVPRTLLEEAEPDADLLVLGSRAYGPLGSVLLGSVSAQVIHTCPLPLLVVPRGAGGQGSGESSQHSTSSADAATERSVRSETVREAGTSASSSKT
jgi:nucleotide-binding universal stress UspA family protein